ncbi:hypothetical protein GT045_06460 [Streptomyces sp. SID486]|uniref:hypothetical protein n=1 Tax=unclassified Streptomyces TaxID=2593676 RepID=UPI001368A765|nr:MULTISPECIES: hypothetical protein [unclassified Streptomyces]MYW15692.1 hypothetical protein [Streptomyces sp. SID2955]MYW21203.1 hypothetical protein [Streptomyces sp. SID2955]MYW42336.1 hypothetical protein [Streptomyces sp. SID161]MYX94461.1 hypothetical protein [Streptomyces sp. SID486]
MAITPARKTLLGGLTAALVLGLGATALALPQTAPTAPSVTATDMPSLVEDFNHPGAAKAQQERGVTLKRGDGHIWLTDVTDLSQCGDTSNIAIESRKGVFCFKTNAKTGYLTLELPDTFSIWTQDHPVKATLTAEGKDTVVNAPANDLTPVGESGDTGLRSVLVEIRVTG